MLLNILPLPATSLLFLSANIFLLKPVAGAGEMGKPRSGATNRRLHHSQENYKPHEIHIHKQDLKPDVSKKLLLEECPAG